MFDINFCLGEMGNQVGYNIEKTLNIHSASLDMSRNMKDTGVSNTLVIVEHGAGRSAKVAEDYFNDHANEYREFIINQLKKVKESSPNILITFGLSGGTGAGKSEPLIRLLKDISPDSNIFLLTSLPMDEEGAISKQRGLIKLKLIRENWTKEKKITGVLLIDNNYCKKIYKFDNSTFDRINAGITAAMLRMVNLYAGGINYSSGYKTINISDIYYVFSAGGFIDVRECVLTLDNLKQWEDARSGKEVKWEKPKTSSLLCNNHSTNKTKKYIAVVRLPENEEWRKASSHIIDYCNDILSMINTLTGRCEDYILSIGYDKFLGNNGNNKNNNAIVDIITAGLPMTKKWKSTIEKTYNNIQQHYERSDSSDEEEDVFGMISDSL